jgi:sulfur-carrier protein
MYASARESAGTAQVAVQSGPTPAVLATLAAGLPARFGAVLAVSSLVCDGRRLDPSSAEPIPATAVIDVLPPFAGG